MESQFYKLSKLDDYMIWKGCFKRAKHQQISNVVMINIIKLYELYLTESYYRFEIDRRYLSSLNPL